MMDFEWCETTLKQLVKNIEERGFYVAFVDLEKAYYKLCREVTMEELNEYGVVMFGKGCEESI